MDLGVIPSFVCCYDLLMLLHVIIPCSSVFLLPWAELTFVISRSECQAPKLRPLHCTKEWPKTPPPQDWRCWVFSVITTSQCNMVREGRDNKLGATCSVQDGSDFMMG